MILRAILAILLCSAMTLAYGAAENYSWPADLTRSPFNCTETSPGVYSCPPISFPKNTAVVVTEPIKVVVNGDFYAFMADVGTSGKALLLDVKGNVTFSQNSSGYMDIKATGNIRIGKNSSIHGDVASTAGDVVIEKNSTVHGNVNADDNLFVEKHGRITGTCTYKTTNYKCSGVATPVFDHFMIVHDGTGITCTPSVITIKACTSAASGGTCTAYTGGASGTILASSGASQELEFDIPDGSSEVTVSLSSPTAATFTLSNPDTKYSCWNGNTTSCQLEFEQAGFVFNDIPNHRAGEEKTSSISAVSTKPGGKTCAPAFTAATNVTFDCSYNNPTSGSSITLTFGSTVRSLTCGTSQTISVPFDGNGQAAFKLTYPDVGNITLLASVGSNMSGQDGFIAAPASFKLTAPQNPIKAGQDANVTVEAMTALAGTPAKSFGREQTPEYAQLVFTRCQPSAAHPDGSLPNDGIFTSSASAFANGVATYTVKWNEVGNGDLAARLASGGYLGSTFSPTGILPPSTSPCGSADGALTSVPHHFKTETGQPVYTYSGQPMKVIVSAHAQDHALTTNYYLLANSTSKTVKALTLEAVTVPAGVGGWNSTGIPLADLKNEADRGKISFTRTYTLTNKLTAPADATIRVFDANTTSSGFLEEVVTNIRNGRLRLSNAFGSVKQDLNIPVMAQYWSGNSWILNADDNYTTVPLLSIALTRSGAASTSNATEISKLVAGQGKILISKPTSGTAGIVDVAINLGDNPGPDASCLPQPHPTTLGSKQPWLRHTYGSCASPADPSARATFGVYPGQTKRTIYVREAYN